MSDPSHLSEAEALDYVQDELPEERRIAVDRHLDRCESCSRNVLGLLDGGGVPLAQPSTDSRAPEAMRTASARALVDAAAELERAARSSDSTSEKIARLALHQADLALLEVIGRPEPLPELVAAGGFQPESFSAALAGARARLLSAERSVLDGAEAAARRLLGQEFERWKSDQPPALEPAAPASFRAAASARPIRFQVRHPLEHEYSLLVEETRREGEAFTLIVCVGPGKLRRWGFRLSFHADDEAAALADLGLSPRELGALRVAHGLEPDRWVRLLDLLLPWRCGSDLDGDDSIFAKPLVDGGVPGHLPGQPLAVRFWLMPALE